MNQLNHSIYKPGKYLADSLIQRFWTVEGKSAILKDELVFPECAVDMVFNLSDPYTRKSFGGNSKPQLINHAHIIGPRTRSYKIEFSGLARIFGIRVNPQIFYNTTGIPIDFLTDKSVRLDTLFKGDAGCIERIFSARSLKKRVDYSLILFANMNCSNNRTITEEIYRNICNGSYTSILGICNKYAIHRSTLGRMMKKNYGLTPTFLIRLVRFQKILKGMYGNKYQSLTELAYACNYYDQAHMINDFKNFLSENPSCFLDKEFKYLEFTINTLNEVEFQY